VWAAERNRLDVRDHVYHELDILHPIMYRDFDLCQLAKHDKLKTKLKVKDLQEICKEFEIVAVGPLSRKDSYVTPLMVFLQECSCVT